MKTYLLTALAICGLGTGYLLMPAAGQEGNADIRVRAPFVAVDVDVDRTHRLEADKPARMSKLLGLTVRNAQQEELGTVEDFVTGTRSGEIRYAALSFGGVLGVGEQLAAIPWKSLRFQHDEQTDESYFVLDVDKEAIRQFPRIDSDDWPDSLDSAAMPEAERSPKAAGEANKTLPDKTAPSAQTR